MDSTARKQTITDVQVSPGAETNFTRGSCETGSEDRLRALGLFLEGRMGEESYHERARDRENRRAIDYAPRAGVRIASVEGRKTALLWGRLLTPRVIFLMAFLGRQEA